MSGPYHVHEGNALQSTSLSLWEKAKNKMAGKNTKGLFPIEDFHGKDVRFRSGTDFGNVKILKGMFKVPEADNNSTYYEILITTLGSSKTISDKYNDMRAIPIGPGNQLTVDD